MSTSKTLLIMAAGSGSRYGTLKQFDTLGPHGEFLMEFGMYDAISAGFNHIVIVTRQDHVAFLQTYFTSKLLPSIKLDVIAQELADIPIPSDVWKTRKKPWGTAHAVWTARNYISHPFIVINADDFYGKAAFEKAATFIEHTRHNQDFGLVAYKLQNTLSKNGSVSRGICKIEDGELQMVSERQRIMATNNIIVDEDSLEHYSGDELVSMNFWICWPLLFNHIGNQFQKFLGSEIAVKEQELFIPASIQHLITTKQIRVKHLVSNAQWYGITYAEDRQEVVAHLAQLSLAKNYTTPLWEKM